MGVPKFPGDVIMGDGPAEPAVFKEHAMERLLTMDKEQFISQMQSEVRRILGEVADAVNSAPTGNVISGSEIAVRDAMARLRERAFEVAVQMRIDSTESSFSPSEGGGGPGEAE
jgi:hypothetical protein